MNSDGQITVADLESQVAAKGLRPLLCPECFLEFTPNEMGTHLERHREVLGPLFSKRGLPRSKACPKKCGRYFPLILSTRRRAPHMDYKIHTALCDGKPPLPPRKIR